MLSVVRLNVVRLNVIRLNVVRLNVVRLNVIRLNVIRLNVIWLNVIWLNVIWLNVIRLNVIRLNVLAPAVNVHQEPQVEDSLTRLPMARKIKFFNIDTRLPKAPRVEMMMLSKTFMVVLGKML
jgi:hypothetical protein